MKTKQRGTLVSGAVVAALLMVHVGHPALCAAAFRYVDPAGSDATNDGSLQAAPTLPAGGNIVTIQGTGVSVDFSGFTVNGPGASGCGSINAGIQVRDHANAAIHDNTVSDIRDEPLSGCQNGRAIRIGETASPASGTVTRNTVVGYQKNGIDLRNCGTAATISDNTIVGAGPTPLIAQNGMVVVSAGATIQGNTVTGNACDHPSCGPDPINDTQSTGVLLLFAQAGSTVSGNARSEEHTSELQSHVNI